MINLFLKLIKTITKYKIFSYTLYLVLPVVSFYLNIFKRFSWELITALLVIIFILRVVVGVIVSFNILSFAKSLDLKKWKKERLIVLLGVKIIIGIFITIIPLFFSNSFTNRYIKNKLNKESEIIDAEIYNLGYSSNRGSHLSESTYYEYKFYVKNEKYYGRHFEREGKIGKLIKIKYYRNNPWINKKNE